MKVRNQQAEEACSVSALSGLQRCELGAKQQRGVFDPLQPAPQIIICQLQIPLIPAPYLYKVDLESRPPKPMVLRVAVDDVF